jgi:crotonobetaine/carnitine-CoA ligase
MRGDVTHTSLPLYHVGGLYADIVSSLVAGSQVALGRFWHRIEKYDATRATFLSVMSVLVGETTGTRADRGKP